MSEPNPDHDVDALIDDTVIQGLIELGGGDTALLCELIDLFLTDGSERVDAIDHGRKSSDLTVIAKSAHSLKSASANMGATEFSGLCKRVESTARDGDEQLALELARQLRSQFAGVQAALRELRTRHAPA